MPAMLIHNTFAKEVIPEEEKPFEDAVCLGSQGPDPFFYYGVRPWKKHGDYEKVMPYGAFLHHTDITPFYAKMIRYAMKSEHKDLLLSYMDGVLMHYTLDRTLHPFIFSQSGMDADGKLSGYFKWSHGAYESLLDVQYSKLKGTFRAPVHGLDIQNDQLIEISKMWKAGNPENLQDDSFLKGVEDYRVAERVLYSRTGIKRGLFHLTGKHSLIMGMSYPKRIKKFQAMDQFNEAKAEWPMPQTGDIRNESLFELIEIAKKDYQKAHLLILGAKKGEFDEAALKAYVDSIDHDGAKLGGPKMTHYSLFWDKKAK